LNRHGRVQEIPKNGGRPPEAVIVGLSSASRLSGELGGVNGAIQVGGGAVILMAAVTVGREGLETSLFFFTGAAGGRP
jgi:hypothetical protein